MTAQLAQPLDAGFGPLGRRVLNAVSQGEFVGERLSGSVNPGTGDWMLTRDGINIVDARVVLKTHDGALIHMMYGGRIWFDEEVLPQLVDPTTRHKIEPSKYYFRTTPLFETGHSDYLWLNGVGGVGVGRLIKGGVSYDVFQVG